MKIEISKNVKRALSMVIAVALLLGTLFTANVGVNIKADAAESNNIKTDVVYWDGGQDTTLADKGETGTKSDPIIIDSAEELNYLFIKAAGGTANTVGKYYKVADNIKTFVLQPKVTFTSIFGSVDDLKNKSADEVKTIYENNAASLKNWYYDLKANAETVFDGNFDGNGVEIVGLYVNADAGNQNSAALIPFIDGGVNESSDTKVLSTPLTIKNFAIRNSFFKGNRRMGAIAGTAYGTNYGALVAGQIEVESCEVANCYFVGQNLKNGTIEDKGVGEMGVMFGSVSNDPVNANNCLVYGNKAEYRLYTDTTTYEVSTSDSRNLNNLFGSNYTNNAINGHISNSVVLGTAVTGVSASYISNVYSDEVRANVTTITEEEAKGKIGKTIMSSFNWATDATAGDYTIAQWYARENDYPTVIMPEGWKDTVKGYSMFSGTAAGSFADGNGSKESPYIIKTADQLYKMVTDGAETEGKYYTIADGVEKLYLNDIIDTNDAATDYSAIEALYNSNKYSNWNTTAEFLGNFDGKGVTLVGMISKDGKGFFGKMSGNATIKNVNFESCYVYSSNSRAAVVATDFGSFDKGDHYPTISNVSVRKSYINSQQPGLQLRLNSPHEIWNSSAGGIASCIATSDMLTITNCMYDGTSSKLVQKDYANGDVEVDASAGILSMASPVNNVTISNCVSLGAPIITEGVGKGGAAINYVRYKSNSKVTATNCYTNTDLTLTSIDGKKVDASYWNAYPLPTTINRVNATDNKYERGNFLYLDWANSWKLVTIDNDTVIPMPTSSTVEPIKSTYTTFGKMLVAHNGIGLRSGSYPNQNGTFGWYHELTGSGTKADPYIIDTAEKLAIAIATGGKNVNQKLYYKLGCDINLGLLPWIDQTQVGNEYAYTPFEGTLDGAGYTVTGLSSIDKSNSAGLIPVLNGGTVKNLHMRNSYAGSTTSAGVIAGSANGGTIIGCSLESSCTGGTSSSAFYGTGTATVKDSYSIVDDVATYYNNSGATAEPTTDFYSSTNPNGTWYKGVGGTPRLVNFAKAHTIADIDGDGVVSDNYTTNDVIALRKFLLGASDYKNIFGDVTGNGKTNISDLAIIRREMVDDYNSVKDGFWRNVELGKVKIYYDQNDSQDMARKLELYLESVYPEVDIVKVAGIAVTDKTVTDKADYNGEENAIVITKDFKESTYKNYSVNYDVNTNVLTVSGNSFTAVEQATLDLISQLQGNSNTANPTNISGAIGTNKFAKTVNGTTYYYAWGDEFDTGKTYSADTWKVKNYRSEGNDLNAKTVSEGRNTHYFNLESTNSASLESLWEVNGGKLTIWRGVNTSLNTENMTEISNNDKTILQNGTYTWGYKGVAAGASDTTNDFGSIIDNDDIYIEAGLITTEQSMMFKQGYAEMRASLPSDGYAFPAWWFYNGTSAKYNVGMTQNLYGKVYETNSNWNGDAKMTQGNLKTYQYKVPQAYLEFDIVEFMQAQSGKSGKNATTTGDYRDYINLTVHKIYDQNATSDLSTLYIPNWSTGTTTEISNADFVNTAGSAGFIHRYNPDRTTANYAHTYTTGSWWWENEYNTAASYSIQKAIDAGKMTQGQTSVTDYYTYGFSWTVDKNAKTYDLTVYVDFNEDGVMASDEIIFNMNQTNGHESSYNGSSFTDPIYNSSDLSADCAVWDQYAYMLLDNSFKTSNPLGSGSTSDDGVTMYTDLLTQKSGNGTAGATDKTTFDIEYVRVYQQNGKRDLVTAETEAFNTGSHFGY